MENRYEGILAQHTSMMRSVLARELRRLYKPGMRVLEVGCGEGDSAEPLLRLTNASMVLLDSSAHMIRSCMTNLMKYADRTQYVCQDALEHLAQSASTCEMTYDIITSSWTIHNFVWSEKEKLLEGICSRLTSGGSFLLMDKVYPKHGGEKLLELQNDRFRRYLEPAVAEAIIAHENQDYDQTCRMDEGAFIDKLLSIGFANVRIVERVERDVVLVGTK